MKWIIATVFLVLLGGNVWQFGKIRVLEKQNLMPCDSLCQVLPKNQKEFILRHAQPKWLDTIQKSMYLEKESDIAECHRVLWTRKYGLHFSIRVDSLKNGELRATAIKYSAKNPLTGEGEDKYFYTKQWIFDKTVWQNFKSSLSKIDYRELTLDTQGYLCCFGDRIIWEASLNNKYFGFQTSCGVAASFTKACYLLLRQIPDEEFQKEIEDKNY
jgi:hypothetical protein